VLVVVLVGEFPLSSTPTVDYGPSTRAILCTNQRQFGVQFPAQCGLQLNF
jgi:hypothetical protein